jgi:acetyltransferase-like isoleucine patch superfamily enzyme
MIVFVKSFFFKLILKFLGVKIGKKFICKNFPDLRVLGKYSNIIIEDNVQILGKIDLRNRGLGSIHFCNNVKIEEFCRFVTANSGLIQICDNSIITRGTIINGGGNVIIKANCIIGPYNIINANDHKIDNKNKIINREFVHGDVVIEEDCWTGAFVSVIHDTKIRKGSVIGAYSFVNKDTEEYSINFGVPSRKIKNR